MSRISQPKLVEWAANETESARVAISGGAFGTLLVPAELDGLTLDVLTDYTDETMLPRSVLTPSAFDGISLLSEPKTLATGANAFTADEIREIGAAGFVRFELSAAPSASDVVQAVLLWKD